MFKFNLFIKYKINKINVVFNAFFRLQTNVLITKKIEMLKSLYDHSLKLLHKNLTTKMFLFYYYVTLIKILNNFKQRLKQTYKNDKH